MSDNFNFEAWKLSFSGLGLGLVLFTCISDNFHLLSDYFQPSTWKFLDTV